MGHNTPERLGACTASATNVPPGLCRGACPSLCKHCAEAVCCGGGRGRVLCRGRQRDEDGLARVPGTACPFPIRKAAPWHAASHPTCGGPCPPCFLPLHTVQGFHANSLPRLPTLSGACPTACLQFSQRPGAGGSRERCFEQAYLCAFAGAWGTGIFGAFQAIAKHYEARLPANPLQFDEGPDVLKVCWPSRQMNNEGLLLMAGSGARASRPQRFLNGQRHGARQPVQARPVQDTAPALCTDVASTDVACWCLPSSTLRYLRVEVCFPVLVCLGMQSGPWQPAEPVASASPADSLLMSTLPPLSAAPCPHLVPAGPN